jgi:hypothetical protein
MYLNDPVFNVVDSVGAPISGAKAYFYQTGTTTLVNTYTTVQRTVANTNPVIADSAGRFPPIYLDPDINYRMKLTDAADILILDRDPIAVAGDGDGDETLVLSNIAALQAYNAPTVEIPELLSVISNYVAGDGGGTFRYDSTDTTTADNGGTVIVDTAGRRWKRQWSGPVEITWFGAISYSTKVAAMAGVDSYAAISAALAASTTVNISPGYYRVTQTITINTAKVTLSGVSESASWLIFDHTVAGYIRTGIVLGTNATASVLQGFSIDHNGDGVTKATVTSQQAIALTSALIIMADEAVVRDLDIYNAWDNGLAVGRFTYSGSGSVSSPYTATPVVGKPDNVRVHNIYGENVGCGVHDYAAYSEEGRKGAVVNNLSGTRFSALQCQAVLSYNGFTNELGSGAGGSFIECVADRIKKDSLYPTNGSGDGFFIADGPVVLAGCRAMFCDGAGFAITPDAVQLDASGCSAYGGQDHGWEIAGQRINLNGCSAYANSLAVANTKDGFFIEDQASFDQSITLTGCIASGSQQRYGVGANTGTRNNQQRIEIVSGSYAGNAVADIDPALYPTISISGPAQRASFRNLLINPTFTVNQRAFAGGSLSAGVYGHDRWKAGSGGANYSISSDTVTLTSGSLFQSIESPNLASALVTVSVEDPTATLTITVAAHDGGSGSVSGSITTGSGRRSLTLLVPSTATASLSIEISGTSAQFKRVQMEIGGRWTPFERRSLADEVRLCQRYFASTYGLNIAPGTAGSAGALATRTPSSGIGVLLWHLPVQMRTAPTVTMYAATTGNSGNVSQGTANVTSAVLSSNSNSVSVYNTAVDVAAESYLYGHMTVSAEL